MHLQVPKQWLKMSGLFFDSSKRLMLFFLVVHVRTNAALDFSLRTTLKLNSIPSSTMDWFSKYDSCLSTAALECAIALSKHSRKPLEQVHMKSTVPSTLTKESCINMRVRACFLRISSNCVCTVQTSLNADLNWCIGRALLMMQSPNDLARLYGVSRFLSSQCVFSIHI